MELSQSEATKPSLEIDTEHKFEDLKVVLSELSAKGGPTQLSTVFTMWKDRKPDAFETVGLTQFKAYLQLAESAGIVAVEQPQGGDGWDTDSDRPQEQVRSRFRDLIKTLNDLRLAGDPEPQFFAVGPQLLRSNPSIYKDAGVTTFEEYLRAATEAGVVTVRGVKQGDGSLKLCPAYFNPPARPPTHTGTTSTPPTRTDATPFPPVNVTANSFHDLITVLKGLRALTGRPIFNFARVTPLLLGRRPDAFASVGVTEFSDYLKLAVKHGVVKAWAVEQSDGWVALSDPGPAESAGPTQSSKSSEDVPPPPSVSPEEGVVDPKFVDLVKTLGEFWRKGDKQPLLSRVGSELLKIVGGRARTLNACGVTNFKAYAKLAKDAQIVEIHEPPGRHVTMSLNPTIRVKAGYT